MRNRTLMIILAVMALLCWMGLLGLMNRKPPTALNQVVFLGILILAVFGTAAPISYGLNGRLARPLSKAAELGRAIRQGLLAGLLSATLMALRFMRVLNWMTGALLVLVAIMVEMMVYLRTR